MIRSATLLSSSMGFLEMITYEHGLINGRLKPTIVHAMQLPRSRRCIFDVLSNELTFTYVSNPHKCSYCTLHNERHLSSKLSFFLSLEL